ncbi:MAG: TerC family protein [Alphaproteobacteria bacterium]
MFDLSFGEAFHVAFADLALASFWIGVVQIIWIDILLAGDNAVVIALACRKLPPKVRTWGMVLGAGVAVVMRIAFTSVVAVLMFIPFLKIVGGLALFYIAVKLLLPDDSDHCEDNIEASTHLWRAVRVIAIADIVMSLDNVIAIAGASGGNPLLFTFGLLVSIPLVVLGARVVMTLLTRFPLLIWVGGALLGWIAGQVIATDPIIKDFLVSQYSENIARIVEFSSATLGAMIVVAAGRKLRSNMSSCAGDQKGSE